MTTLDLDRITKIAYEEFVRGALGIAPTIEVQWEKQPETVKRIWRCAIQSALTAASQTDA